MVAAGRGPGGASRRTGARRTRGRRGVGDHPRQRVKPSRHIASRRQRTSSEEHGLAPTASAGHRAKGGRSEVAEDEWRKKGTGAGAADSAKGGTKPPGSRGGFKKRGRPGARGRRTRHARETWHKKGRHPMNSDASHSVLRTAASASCGALTNVQRLPGSRDRSRAPHAATPMDPELTSARRCRPLIGNIRRWGRYSSTCHRQKVTCGLRNVRTIGTSFNASR